MTDELIDEKVKNLFTEILESISDNPNTTKSCIVIMETNTDLTVRTVHLNQLEIAGLLEYAKTISMNDIHSFNIATDILESKE